MQQGLIERIGRKEATITVVGLGHVGLPTAIMFAKSGFQVIGVDMKPEVVESVSSRKSHIREPELEDFLREVVENGRLKATTDLQQAFRNSEIGLVCVQTPLTGKKQPDLSLVRKAFSDIARSLGKGKLVVIESSVPPGTTRNLAKMLETESKLKCGRDFWLAHCPERILVGNAVRDFVQSTRIVGGYNETSTEIAVKLFRKVTRGKILATDCTTAEVAKLAENSFRDVNIAFANELALICEKIGVDVLDVVKLANTHPRVRIHNPGPGVGGPCITKDPLLLLDSVKKHGFRSKVMQNSRELNEHMPEHIVALTVGALEKVGKDVKTSKIAILGAAYKGETDDPRNSPSEAIVHSLMKLGSNVVIYDPYTTESFGATRASDIRSALKGANCVVMATEHKMFKKLELTELRDIMSQKPVIVDGRRLIDPLEAMKLGFRYVGVGFKS